MNWQLSHRFDRRALPITDSHYSRQKPGSPQFVPPGRCVVLLTKNADALWTSSWPFAEYVKHAWAGAWVNSLFCNRGSVLSSELILEAVAVTRWFYDTPLLGMITFINEAKTAKRRSKRSQPGECYIKAGFRQAVCPNHMIAVEECAACNGRSKGGLVALQLLPDAMPEAMKPDCAQMDLMDAS